MSVAALLAATMAHAAEPTRVFGTCHAQSGSEILVQEALDGKLEWVCDRRDYPDGAAVAWLRFDMSDTDVRTDPPRFFSSRVTKLDRVSIIARRDGERIAENAHDGDFIQPLLAGPVFALPLPRGAAPADEYIVRIERPHSATVASEARITGRPDPAEALRRILALAAVAGMLLVPLFFDAVYFKVLRQRFVLLHAGTAVSMLGYTLFSGGLISAFWRPDIATMAILGPLFWAFAIGLSGFFIADFLEKDAVPDWQRKALRWCGAMVIGVSGFASLQLDATQAFDNQLYFAPFPIVIAIFVIALVTALRRGSRAGFFLTIAWLPMLFAAGERLLRGIGLYGAESSIDVMLFVALGLNVIIASLAIADRFLALRRERDRAVSEAEAQTRLSKQDPLTGLLNRRGIEPEFDTLLARGFHTFGLIDLDHFKSFNDEFGHDIGDQVLCATAEAIRSDDDVLAIRMGGEEFLVLLKGDFGSARAERLRQAITLRTSRDVTEIDRLVTASMGVVELPEDISQSCNFSEIYSRADRLLYQAKEAGRNRMLKERLEVHDVDEGLPPQPARPRLTAV